MYGAYLIIPVIVQKTPLRSNTSYSVNQGFFAALAVCVTRGCNKPS